MRTLRLILALLVAVAASRAFAKTKAEEGESEGKVKASRDLRTDKDYEFLLPIGFSEGLGFGIGGGSFLGRDTLIELSYIESTNFLFSSSHYAALRLKRYFGNSFYAIGGLGYRETTYDGVLSDVFDSLGTTFAKFGDPNVKSVETEARATTIGVDVGVGNQWQWQTFSFGCEWLGAYKPLTVLKSDATITTSYEDDTPDKTEKVDIPDENYLTVGYHALMATFAWTW